MNLRWKAEETLTRTAHTFAETHFGNLGFDVNIIMQDEAVTRNIKAAIGLFSGAELESLTVPPLAVATAPAQEKPPIGRNDSSEALSPPSGTAGVTPIASTTVVSKKSWCKRLSCCP